VDCRRLLISLHIPKTGGQSFLRSLEALAEGDVIQDYHNRPLVEGFVERRLRHGGIDLVRLREIAGRLERTTGWVIVHGHFLAGKYRSVFPEARYICWIRDPVQRVCSHYAYWKYNSTKMKGVPEHLKPGLIEFATQERIRNMQTRFLCQTRLEAFDFVGITQEFDRSMRLFHAWSGTTLPAFKPLNQNANRNASGYRLDAETRARIEEVNSEDMDLYSCAIIQYEKLCSEHGIT
jgi:hypothetical protein